MPSTLALSCPGSLSQTVPFSFTSGLIKAKKFKLKIYESFSGFWNFVFFKGFQKGQKQSLNKGYFIC